MTLTTQTGISATETVRSDIPTGNRVLPNGQVLSEEAQILFNKSIVAKPLGIPAQEQIRVKNNAFRYRWVNRKGQGGAWYAKMKSLGFVLATTDDVDPMAVEMVDDHGEIRMDDVVLMKMPVEKYQGAIKYNAQKALALQKDRKYIANDRLPSTDPRSDDSVVVRSVADGDKSLGEGQYVRTFTPTEEELDSKMGKDRSGRK